MYLQHLFEGYVIGFSVGTTIGVSGLLALQNMMTGQISVGLASVFATACADMTCGALVFFGLQTVESFLITYKTNLSILAGVLLCLMGFKKLFSKVDLVSIHTASGHLWAAFGSIYFLSLIDPVSILDFMTLCLGLTVDFSIVHSIYLFIIGIFLGSLSWWLLVYSLVLVLKRGLSVSLFQMVQYLVGICLLFFGLWTLLKNII